MDVNEASDNPIRDLAFKRFEAAQAAIEPHLNGVDPRALVDAASDNRTANNAVRHQYRVLDATEKETMIRVKDAGAAFLLILETYCKPGRETSLARTKIEEAVMWAVKGITE